MKMDLKVYFIQLSFLFLILVFVRDNNEMCTEIVSK